MRRTSPRSELASTALAVAPTNTQGKAVAIRIGKILHPCTAESVVVPAMNDLRPCTIASSDCQTCENSGEMTVAAMFTPHVTSPALMAIGIRHLGEPSRQAFSSIWAARPLSPRKRALPHAGAAPIAGFSAPMALPDIMFVFVSVPVLNPTAQRRAPQVTKNPIVIGATGRAGGATMSSGRRPPVFG